MTEEKIVAWENQTTKEYPDDEKKETFRTIVSRAYAKKKDGEKLTEKERWALKNAAKQSKYIMPTGPRKATLQMIENVVKLQLEEGLSYSEIAERLGKSPTTIAHLVGRHDREYRKALQRLADDAIKDAGIRRPVIYGRMLTLYQRAALRAPLVMESIMDDPQQPGGVRAKAAQDAMDRFDMGKDATQAKIAAQAVNPDALQIIKDTIGIMERLKALSEPSVASVEAEVIDETLSGEVPD